ncbi:MAG TPA: RidA family protein [Kofleriaceae bacterium]|nr:RidA family protein [Kofleriaceae bacterium]
MVTERVLVSTEQAPAAIGPYSQAITAGGLVFCSGQIPIDPATGELCQGDVAAQTAQVLTNLAAVLDSAGSSLGAMVKTTIYLTDLGDYGAVNRVYGERVGSPPPARACVEVAALPKGAKVEIDAIAVCG